MLFYFFFCPQQCNIPESCHHLTQIHLVDYIFIVTSGLAVDIDIWLHISVCKKEYLNTFESSLVSLLACNPRSCHLIRQIVVNDLGVLEG